MAESTCPWGAAIQSVRGSPGAIRIDSHRFRLNTRHRRERLVHWLEFCGYSSAIDEFRAWRGTRRVMAYCILTIYPLPYVVPACMGLVAILSNARRADFERALMRGPDRRRSGPDAIPLPYWPSIPPQVTSAAPPTNRS